MAIFFFISCASIGVMNKVGYYKGAVLVAVRDQISVTLNPTKLFRLLNLFLDSADKVGNKLF